MSNAKARAELEQSVQYLRDTAQAQGRDDDLVVVLIRESADLLKRRQPRGRGSSEEQARYLVESGAFGAEELADTEREVADGLLVEEERQTRLGALARTLSTAEVAQHLHLDASRVRHRQAKGLLYGVLVGGKRRYPSWQLVPGTTQSLPHLGPVARAFPEDWHPAGVEAFMTTPKSSLLAGSSSTNGESTERLTPVEWLLTGRDPEAIVRILDSFLQS